MTDAILCPSCGEENPARFRLCGFCGTPLAPAQQPQETRKLVTLLFCDLKGSTNLGEHLDSESLREVMSRYFDAMSAAITQHGGTIEKFIGDAVMAVFGLPRVHEDDALRAVRAALAMQEALVELNGELRQVYGVELANRIGVNTGEVVAGDPTAGQRLVTGDPVNVAARLEQAAGASEALLGELTYRLVREHVDVEAVAPLELKGKAQRVPAYRLVSLRSRQQHDTQRSELVGREVELALLEAEVIRSADERRCRLVTLLAAAGVGKSRVIAELASRVAGRATVVRGRCLPYGRGITFWPLVEIARELTGAAEDDTPADAYRKLLNAADGDTAVAERVASVTGLGERQFPVEEVLWATRRLLETRAAERPVLVCIEDVHWAEQTLLDLIAHVHDAARDAAITLVCAARPTLAEIRPDWGSRGHTLELEPLSLLESEAIVRIQLGDADLPDSVVTRIVAAAEGNPLYVEQIVSMLVESGMLRPEDGRWVSTVALADIPIPPTIQALLAARLDLLGPAERTVVEPASVIGHVFAREAVEHLVAPELAPAVASQLVSLTNKQLVRPETGGADDLYRFHHILIRDAAYRSMLKRARAALHERFVEWAEQVNRDRDRSVEYDEILGYHLEQAHDYLVELGPLDDHGRSIGVRGSEKLAAAGTRAFARGDMPAAANLLRRAAALRPESDPARLRLLPPLAEAMMEIGEFAWAQTVLDDAIECGDARLRANAELTRLLVLHHTADDLSAWRQQVVETTERVIPQLEILAATQELAHAWRLLGFVHGSVCRWGEQVAAVEQALAHARAAGDLRLEARLSAAYTIGLRDGPTTVPDAILGCVEIVDRRLPDRQAEAIAIASLACLLAMAGDFEAARERYRAARDLLAELGGTVLTAFTAIAGARVELLDGDAAGAERELAPAYDALGRLGERYFRPLVGAYLARALLETGKLEQAARVAGDAAAAADEDDVEAQALLGCVRAQIEAQAGDPERAAGIVAAAVAAAQTTDSPVLQANVLVEAGRVLATARRSAEAEAAFASAEALYRAKGDTVSAARLGETMDGAATPYAAAGVRSRLPPAHPSEGDRPPPAR